MPRKKINKPSTVPYEKQCGRSKSDGHRCEAPKQNGKDHCVRHGEAKTFGGTLTHDENDMPRKFDTYEDVLKVLEWEQNALRNGESNSHQSRALASLALAALKAIEMKEKKGGGAKKLNGREALEIIGRGLGGGLAREVLLSRNFDLLKNPADILDVTPKERAMRMIEKEMEEKEDESNPLVIKTVRRSAEPEPIRANSEETDGRAGLIGDLFT